MAGNCRPWREIWTQLWAAEMFCLLESCYSSRAGVENDLWQGFAMPTQSFWFWRSCLLIIIRESELGLDLLELWREAKPQVVSWHRCPPGTRDGGFIVPILRHAQWWGGILLFFIVNGKEKYLNDTIHHIRLKQAQWNPPYIFAEPVSWRAGIMQK